MLGRTGLSAARGGQGTLLVLTLLLLARAAPAEDDGTPETAPRTATEAADRAQAAFAADDTSTLVALAGADVPDPWIVADELSSRGAHDAAKAFAEATSRLPVARLPAYVASRRGQPAQTDAREALVACDEAAARGAWDTVHELAVAHALPLDSVAGLRLGFAEGRADAELRRLEESATRLADVAQAAEELGWLRLALDAYDHAGLAAWLRSDWPLALVTQEAALQIRRDLGDEVGVVRMLSNIGLLQERVGRFREAVTTYEEALETMRRLDYREGIATALGNLGNARMRLAEYDDALTLLRESLALHEELGDEAAAARVRGNIGVVYESLGDLVGALEIQEEALARKRDLGDARGIASTLGNVGNLLMKLGDHRGALGAQEEALAIKEEIEDRAGAALTLGNIGVLYQRLGDYPRAFATHRRALEVKQDLGDRFGAARSLGNLGIVHFQLGDYPTALATLEEALATLVEIGDREGAAQMLLQIGSVHLALGLPDRALRPFEKARAISEEIGDRSTEAWTMQRIGSALLDLDETDRALAMFERALERMEAIGDVLGVARVLALKGVAHEEAGRYDDALAALERSRAASEEAGDRAGVVWTLGHQGRVHALRGDPAAARRALDRAIREARHLRLTATLATLLGWRAEVHLASGDAALALADAQAAVRQLEDVLGGLGDEEGASARAEYADVFGVGALAAARLDDPAEALALLESGRAGALLESLRGRGTLRWSDLPEPLRVAEAQAKAAEVRCRHEYERALGSGSLSDVRRTAAALDEARDQVRQAAARIQRTAKREAGLFYPRAAPLEEVQRHLPPQTALLLYGLCLDRALAVVVTPKAARIVDLGEADAVRAACDASAFETGEGNTDDALARLESALVDPLGLSPDIRRILVSPEERLCYVPFGALWPTREVVLTPSGTTHVLLQEDVHGTGRGVLAVGDPVYAGTSEGPATLYTRGQGLRPLPATRAEALAVGDVVLLGEEASEIALRRELPQVRRWRAVHLACHGLVDIENPTLSALALTRRDEEDGFLTALEVLRMEIPTDLAVLSACRTARGRIVRGEGIVGLARAFMYAGSPRVLCSLWKVDDEATRALMERFYELWKPQAENGPSAAEALRDAQAHVRSQDGWEHPYYWAAWVIWGLP
ncbi:MAG: CHAT domain-containing tetratricopeptide repeat protein [Planctomycetota bacterium]|jgi:CHAT domain-containing protein